MAYIGKQPIVGNYQVLDPLTASATATYALTKASVAVFPQTPANCIVSLNGVIQAPYDSYTISGSNIVFASALTASDSIDFITVLGDVLNIGTPSDNTVSLAKLTATGTPSASTFLRGDNTWGSAGASAGQVIQVVQATETTERSTTSTSFVSLTFNASITPSSASNKILVILSGTLSVIVSQGSAYINIYRGATALSSSTNGFTGAGVVGDYATNTEKVPLHISYLDSPSSTSSVTYTMYGMAQSGKTCKVNNGGAYQTSFILMEIKG